MASRTTAGATMYITLKSYLQQLKDAERSKPKEERRPVPTLLEIANEIGLSDTAISNISTNNISQMNLETGGKIIAVMRARGFPMDVGDLLKFRPAMQESE